MKYKIFFCDYCEDKILEPHEAIEIPIEDILHSMDCVLHIPKNFFGIIDEEDNTLQFIVNDDKSIVIDIPSAEKRGSYTKNIELKDCIEIVRNLESIKNVVDSEELDFFPWG